MAGREELDRNGKRKAGRNRTDLIIRIQHAVMKLLKVLLELLREAHFLKGLLTRLVALLQGSVGRMSPARFTYWLIALAITIVLAAILYAVFNKSEDGTSEVWKSPETALLFLQMQDPNKAKPDYRREDAREAIRLLKDQMGTFVRLVCEPLDPVPGQRLLRIRVGCFQQGDTPKKGILKIRLPTPKSPVIVDTYDSTNGMELKLGFEHAVQLMREQIFRTYPLQGSLRKVPPVRTGVSGQPVSQKGETVELNIGLTAGARDHDIFHVLDPNNTRKRIASVEITKLRYESSDAEIRDVQEELHANYPVRWAKSKGSSNRSP